MNNKKKTFNPLGRGLSELFAEKNYQLIPPWIIKLIKFQTQNLKK